MEYDTYLTHVYPPKPDIRPFYVMPSPDDNRFSNSYDVILRGQEICSGAQVKMTKRFSNFIFRSAGRNPISNNSILILVYLLLHLIFVVPNTKTVALP